ncbi:GNAT family N-acetyltransferase [Helicovermis profundi]|uniref:GNAT family N-acetyltransferase n=1 Tax=Helicovermis profundi TaxID=3065157 RepID=A0AAU9EAW9_9FIRM|nr:GNAT family N-acetyltransferase [Clostridia bacterium S502]
MVRVVNEEDRKNVLEFLLVEPSINIFIIGDIENEGFNKDYQTLWGYYDSDNVIKGVLLKYYNYFIVYYNDQLLDTLEEELMIIAEFKELLKSFPELNILSGKSSIIEKFSDVFYKSTIRREYFLELSSSELLKEKDANVQIAKLEDAKAIYDLRNTIIEFRKIGQVPLERIQKEISENKTKIYFYKNREGEIISLAQITAENKDSAMVIGVCTKEGDRGKGYASKCVSNLARDLLLKNKKVCLFYDNELAGKIYHRLGFENIGNWSMLINKYYSKTN